MKKSEEYTCRKCGYVLPKKDAKISGYDSGLCYRHVHCSKCGKIVCFAP